MAKKRVKRPQKTDTEPKQMELAGGDWTDVVPESVQAAADERMRTLRAKNKATEKFNTANDACMEAMESHGIKRIRIDDGKKWLVYDKAGRLKTEKIKSPTEE